MTAYELTLFIQQRAEAEQAEFRNGMALAWHTAAFSRSKRLPALRPMMKRLGAQFVVKRQSPEEMLKTFQVMAAAGLGKMTQGNPEDN